MKRNQKGFGIVEILLIIVVVVFIGFAGWYVWQKHTNNKSNKTTSLSTTNPNEPTSQKAVARDCHEDWHDSSQSFEFIPWLDVTSSTVDLCKWNVSITLPADQVNKAVYKYYSTNFSGTYYFSTHAVIDDQKCLDYYMSQESEYGAPGTYSVTRFQGTDNGELPEGTLLQNYYLTHKATDGEYMVIGDSRYYKVGGYFFGVSPESTVTLNTYTALRKANCVNEKPNFRSTFSDAFATIKAE